VIIFGLHSCEKTFKLQKTNIVNVYVTKGKKIPSWLLGHNFTIIDEKEMSKKLPNGAVHQGIAIEMLKENSYYVDLEHFRNSVQSCCIAILDGVTDPHNFGSIIRSAAVFGIVGLIITSKSSCKLNGTVIKTASGGIEHVPICIVKNVTTTIEILKEYGFWIYALAENGQEDLHKTSLIGKVCFILGAENNGIRKLPKEKSDFLVKIPTSPDFTTLNVSNAAAIAFHSFYTHRLSKSC
jgi:23S rRNA (guanosine2251-2'-O)-methyltransferase